MVCICNPIFMHTVWSQDGGFHYHFSSTFSTFGYGEIKPNLRGTPWYVFVIQYLRTQFGLRMVASIITSAVHFRQLVMVK